MVGVLADTGAGAASRGDLVVEGLCFGYDETPVLEDVSIAVPAGTVATLLGPSGCGKTTLLRLIAGLERPRRGAVYAGGEALSTPRRVRPPEKRRVGMVFQEGALFPHLNVAANVAFGLPRAGRAGAVAEALALVGLAGLEERAPASLSGGQRQRVALARALAPGPDALLLDEPFASLDPSLRVDLRAEVSALLQRLAITTVFVTHDQENAFVMGTQVIVMREGRVLQSAPPDELYDRPANPWVASFVGEANLVAGRSDGEGAETIAGRVPLARPAPAACEVLLRPEHLVLDRGGPWRIERTEFYGHDTRYQLRDEDGRALTVRAAGAPRHRDGDRASVRYLGPPTVAFEAS